MNSTPCTEVADNTTKYSFSLAPRCGANTRTGALCKSPAIRYKKRCRMHGGKGSGAPKGNQNAFKHGYNSKCNMEQRKEIREILTEYKAIKSCIFD